MTLDDFLENKSRREIIDIMFEALDLMHQYNGRSRMYCIVVAAGGGVTEDEDGSVTYSIPISSDTHVEVVDTKVLNKTVYVHRRVKAAEYRIRKMRSKDLYSVTEYYKGKNVGLADNNLTLKKAHELAVRLSDRDSF